MSACPHSLFIADHAAAHMRLESRLPLLLNHLPTWNSDTLGSPILWSSVPACVPGIIPLRGKVTTACHMWGVAMTRTPALLDTSFRWGLISP